MATPIPSIVMTMAAIVQCSTRDRAENSTRWFDTGQSPFSTRAGVIALGWFGSPARRV